MAGDGHHTEPGLGALRGPRARATHPTIQVRLAPSHRIPSAAVTCHLLTDLQAATQLPASGPMNAFDE